MEEEKDFEALYSRYLHWFKSRAAEGALPFGREDFPRFRSFHEDVYEDDRMFLNRAYYFIPLAPSESVSGRLEIFAFSVLNFMEKEGDDLPNAVRVEYRIE